jgi:predicted porin
VRAAEFTEATAGLAYRPVNNDRLNALARFQYYADLGPIGQITGSGQTQSPKQVSSLFSADFNYDLTQKLTFGAKYGYRQGRVSLGRDSNQFVSSDAHLVVVRLDYGVTKEWDVLAEGRTLWVTLADDKRLGALGAIYRHIGNNVKIGVGYSWSDFSDDLTDQSYTSKGPFFNLIGKF